MRLATRQVDSQHPTYRGSMPTGVSLWIERGRLAHRTTTFQLDLWSRRLACRKVDLWRESAELYELQPVAR